MTNKKGIAPIIIGVIAVSLLLLAMVPGLGNSLIAVTTPFHEECTSAPYDPLCLCLEEGKQRTQIPGDFRNFCESTSKVINPESDPAWQEKALQYCQERIWAGIPVCSMKGLQCNDANDQLDIDVTVTGVGATLKREVHVMCREQTSPNTLQGVYRCWYDIEDGKLKFVGERRILECNPSLA